jgi:hypothetical protein
MIRHDDVETAYGVSTSTGSSSSGGGGGGIGVDVIKTGGNKVVALVATEDTPLLKLADGNVNHGGGDNNMILPPPSDEILPELDHATWQEKFVTGTAALTVLLSIVSILLEATTHPVVYVSGILGTILAPYAALQQRKMTEIIALQQTNQRMELEIQQLQTENNVLQKEITKLEEVSMEYVYGWLVGWLVGCVSCFS